MIIRHQILKRQHLYASTIALVLTFFESEIHNATVCDLRSEWSTGLTGVAHGILIASRNVRGQDVDLSLYVDSSGFAWSARSSGNATS